ncbi:M23 family metallopeptidase [Enterococcus montenegrensis]|uniref:M23 family metallopeptidase n=1 Tax=Enterococcus montenegrensis TaxID=3031993 RepID=UPI00249E391B|nr:M23 family metallopeptidase [Enterococcus montenegrensis]WHA08996.1 M23 family metallopeptidase [Enterococcus montenegrensis]
MKLKKTILTISLLGSLFFSSTAFASENSDKLATVKEDVTQSETKINDFKSQIEDAQSQIKINEETKTTLTGQLDKEIEKLAGVKEQLTKKEAQQAEVAASFLGSSLDLLNGLQGKEQIEAQVTKLKEEQSSQRIEVAALQGKLAQLEQTNQELATKATKLAQEQANFEKEIATKKATIEKLAAKVKAEEEQAEKVAQTGFASPLVGSLNVSSPFGWRQMPLGGGNEHHDGIDLTGSTGQTVMAARDGVVVEAGFDASCGNHVIIKHDNGYYTYYFHLTTIEVSNGANVSVGQRVGGMGTTGNSTGVHLHFGVATGMWDGFVDPAPLIGA